MGETHVAPGYVSNVAPIHGVGTKHIYQSLVQRGAGLEDAQAFPRTLPCIPADSGKPGRLTSILGTTVTSRDPGFELARPAQSGLV